MTATTQATTKAPAPSPVAVDVGEFIGEFIGYVTELGQVAGLLRDTAPEVAPELSFDDAVDLLSRCRDSIGDVETANGSLADRIAVQWQAGEQAVVEIADQQVEVVVSHHREDRREWDHGALVRAVVERRLAQRVEKELPAPDPFTVAAWVIEAALPSYWRLHVLDELGIDASEFCRKRHERVQTRRRPKAVA